MRGDHGSQQENVGAYLLGALSELEARVFERHLMGCAACRDEVERLRMAAEALPQSVTQLRPPASLKRELFERVAAEPRSGGEEESVASAEEPAAAPSAAAPSAGPSFAGRAARRRGGPRSGRVRALWPRAAAGAAAAVLLAAALAGGYGLGRDDRNPPPPAAVPAARSLSATVDRSRLPDASGSLLVRPGSGDPAILRVQGLPVPTGHRVYQVWLLRGGETIPATVFAVRSDGSAEAAITRGLGDADAVLVTREREGGARAPSEVPVLAVRLG